MHQRRKPEPPISKRVHSWRNVFVKFNNYRLPTKFQEGNVFSRVCPHVTITHDALHLTAQGPPAQAQFPWTSDLRHLPPPGPAPCWWHLVVITGDLFKLVHSRTSPPRPRDIFYLLPVYTIPLDQNHLSLHHMVWQKYPLQFQNFLPVHKMMQRILDILQVCRDQLTTSKT